MHSLGCYFQPRGGSLLMLDTTRVAHGTMPHVAHGDRRRIGVALQTKVLAGLHAINALANFCVPPAPPLYTRPVCLA